MFELEKVNFFVFTGGKTGGSTFTATLKNYFGDDKILHIHSNKWLFKKFKCDYGVINLIGKYYNVKNTTCKNLKKNELFNIFHKEDEKIIYNKWCQNTK